MSSSRSCGRTSISGPCPRHCRRSRSVMAAQLRYDPSPIRVLVRQAGSWSIVLAARDAHGRRSRVRRRCSCRYLVDSAASSARSNGSRAAHPLRLAPNAARSSKSARRRPHGRPPRGPCRSSRHSRTDADADDRFSSGTVTTPSDAAQDPVEAEVLDQRGGRCARRRELASVSRSGSTHSTAPLSTRPENCVCVLMRLHTTTWCSRRTRAASRWMGHSAPAQRRFADDDGDHGGRGWGSRQKFARVMP